ncbi:MAG: 16S rRNA (cytosine(967)-C(5))-methyltransferase RsmB [Halobacteria archaeon]|nr:16S rRNA (cytosine(967)-C(5))-methyltransferase RsmB [Halobacteria archaeon]
MAGRICSPRARNLASKTLARSLSPRLAAVQTITQVLRNGRNLPDALEGPLSRVPNDRDRALAQAMAYGVIRWYWRLNWLLSQLLTAPLKQRDVDIQASLMLGLYQLMEMRIPDHAAVAESVKLASQLKKTWAKSLLNGVLRNFQRQREGLLSRMELDPVARSAHPLWLLQQLQQDWPQDWESITAANNASPPMTLRVNPAQHDWHAYQALLMENGITCEPAHHTECGLTLAQPVGVEQLPGFSSGAVSVQDAAAQLATQVLDAQPGERVLDACAAPGGKTAHIMERQPALGELVALDISEERLQRLKENLNRLQVSATTRTGDAAQPTAWWDEQPFDRILLDAPCSASGVIRRHPDIKLLRRAEDLPHLTQTQAQILSALWPLLKPGGMLLYATCSVLQQENSQQIQRFLATQADARLTPIKTDWGHDQKAGRQILPGEDGMDGFFYACIHKA